MQVLLVAHDVGPTKALKKVSEVQKEGVRFVTLLCNGQSPTEDVAKQFEAIAAESDVVLCGISSPAANAAIERRMADVALAAGKKVGFFADTFGAWSRPWLIPLRDRTSIVFVAHEDERMAVMDAFKRASARALGNPNWDEYFLPRDREEARARLGYERGERIILSPGMKDPVLNIDLWTAVIGAARAVVKPLRVVLARHPGDRTDPELYARLLSYGTETARIEFLPSTVTSDDAVPAVNVIVHTGNSSVGLHGLCRKIPVVDCRWMHLGDAYIERETGGWEQTPNAYQATLQAFDRLQLANHLEQAKPPPFGGSFIHQVPGESAKQIATALVDR